MSLSPRRRSLACALVALALLALPAAAGSAGQISLYGSASSSHLRLTTSGEDLVAEGKMGDLEPRGCQISADRMKAVCPLAGISSVEVTMGAAPDYVHADSPLPIPLTIYLGAGSDKFVGNDEADTCFSQGARRNRCIGGGGDDTCLTGIRNSDCVGNAGNDYCRTQNGSDGCWGGPGDDICVMGRGQDGCHGDAGNDRLYGGGDPDRLYGGSGWDYCDGGPGRGKSRACDAGPLH